MTVSTAIQPEVCSQSLTNRAAAQSFVEHIPIAFARRFAILGFDETDDSLVIAMPALDRLAVAENVGVRLGKFIEPVIADESAIQSAINQAYGQRDSGVEHMVERFTTDSAADVLSSIRSDSDLLDDTVKAPVVRLINAVLSDAVKRRASDVHLQPFEDSVKVRLRIDGVLYDYVAPPKHLHEEVVSRVKVMAQLNIAEKRLPQDGRTTVTLGDRIIDLRISTLPTSHGERVVLRLLDKSARLYRLNELGMRPQDMERFAQWIRRSHGIILVTGPTGSGKTTTLYSALQELNATELNIVTLEDPIEYQLDGISQTQVAVKKGMTFATGLRTVLRQDPDVIMVGEIRDEETARMAVQSALTGHLVFSTLHTNDAGGAVARLLDLGVEPYLVAGSVVGVMAQRLVRCICRHCTTRRPMTDHEQRQLGIRDGSSEESVSEGTGCDPCLNSGYYDRIGIFELLEVNERIRGLILQRADSSAISRAAVSDGMGTLRRDALAKMLEGRTTPAEVLRATQDEG